MYSSIHTYMYTHVLSWYRSLPAPSPLLLWVGSELAGTNAATYSTFNKYIIKMNFLYSLQKVTPPQPHLPNRVFRLKTPSPALQ